MTEHEADAATLRTLASRMERRGEEGFAAMARQMADWMDECVEVPADLVADAFDRSKKEIN